MDWARSQPVLEPSYVGIVQGGSSLSSDNNLFGDETRFFALGPSPQLSIPHASFHSSTLADVEAVAPRAFTFTGLDVEATAVLPGGASLSMTTMLNGVSQAGITASVAAGTSGSGLATGSVPIAQDDLVALRVVAAGFGLNTWSLDFLSFTFT